MASAHQRANGKWIGMYRSEGRQLSAGTFATEELALSPATVAEHGARPAEPAMLMRLGVRGRRV